jgi:hypothetical protein
VVIVVCCGRSNKSEEVTDTDCIVDQKVSNDTYYMLPLSEDRIHWVDSKNCLHSCIDEIVKVCSACVCEYLFQLLALEIQLLQM